MSKAFTKEDSNQEDELPDPQGPAIPAGTKNYITPFGVKKLETELEHLSTVERPKVVDRVAWAASLGDRSENADYIYGKKRLKEIDRRIRFLSKRLDSIEIVDPSKRPHVDQVFFGATVTVLDEDSGKEIVYRVVGVDETDAASGKISWISPVGRALLKAKVGDSVSVRLPDGERELEILKVEYKTIE